jgi:hypothetical protein
MKNFKFEDVVARYPKKRMPLPLEYENIYKNEYISNRISGGLGNKIARNLESWMHKKVSGDSKFSNENLLELGAGSLNHLVWEKNFSNYDVVEPFQELFETSKDVSLVKSHYKNLSSVPRSNSYDRIISVAVLEHILDLPYIVALSGLLLKKSGSFCSGIPSEGSLAWMLAWKYGTGPGFKRRTGLDYKIIMKHEHVNESNEIEICIKHFYKKIAIKRFPFDHYNSSIYTYINASEPDLNLCKDFCLNWESNQNHMVIVP